MYKPPICCKMVGSSKYAPLTNLPSQSLPPVMVPLNCVYKPSWMLQHIEKPAIPNSSTQQPQQSTQPQPQPQIQQQQQQQQPRTPQPTPIPTTNNVQNSMNSQFPPSPLHPGFRAPPPPYELSSPATSTASSYLNKNLNSVEPVSTPSVQRAPEASSLLVNILLADTALNIFRDHNFDSCTLCVCNAAHNVVGNIRGADAGVYLVNSSSNERGGAGGALQQPNSPFLGMGMGQPPPYGGILSPQHSAQMPTLDEDSISCSCGFSAVVNRRLSHRSGLFYEDEMEITGKFIYTASNGAKLVKIAHWVVEKIDTK